MDDDVTEFTLTVPADLMVATTKGRAPCRECGKPHTEQVMPRGTVSWADPNDGHSYRQMDVSDFARLLLGFATTQKALGPRGTVVTQPGRS